MNRKRTHTILLLLFFVLLCTNRGFSGGWTQGKGHFYAKFSVLNFSNSSTFNVHGQKLPNIHSEFMGALGGVFKQGTFKSQGFSFYTEVGISPRVDIIVGLYGATLQNKWQFSKGANPDIVQKNQGLVSFTGGAKINLIDKPLIFSLKLTALIPTYQNNLGALNIEPEDLDFFDNTPALGNGAVVFALTPQFGYAFKTIPIWLELESGIRLRSKLFSDEIPLFLQAGYSLKNHTFLAVSLNLVKSLGNGDWPNFYRNDIGKGPYVINDQEFVDLGLSAGKKLFRMFWAEASYLKTLSGKRMPAGQSITLGLAIKH
ncbi:MAG: hypothetical protein ACE5HS_05020 [bacterium]